MSFVFLENCFYKECITIFVNWRYSKFLYQSKQQMVLKAIRFLLSLKANMETILIHFQQNFASVKKFSTFRRYISDPKKTSCTFEACFNIFVQLAKKCDVFLLELYLAIDPSNLASENDVTELSELQSKNNLLPSASSFLGSASSKILVIIAIEEISVMWALVF